MTFSDYLLLFGGMGLATYFPRALPLIYLAHRKMPAWLIEWLQFIPVAILSALLAPSLFSDTASRSLYLGKIELFVAIPTFIFAIKTRSLGGTVIFGMILYWLSGLF
jgi:branched-subunit amino acid transport protein